MWVVRFIVLLLIVAGVYLVECVVDPYARCRREACEGGRIYTKDRVHWHRCRRCGGTGERRRLGRWLLDKLAERHRGDR